MALMPDPMPPDLAVEIEPFTDEELDAAIDAIFAGDADAIPATVGTFELSDDARAEWAMRKLQAFEIHLAEVEEQYAYWIEKLESRLTELTARWQARSKVFRVALERYAVIRRLADPKNAATIQLPSGVLKTVQGKQATIVIGEEELFARWAKEHLPADQLGKVVVDVPKVYVSELRKLPNVRTNGAFVEWSRDGEKGWIRIAGCVAEEPKIKPTVSPDLHR